MLFTTEGVVIRERSVGENDKFVDILTKTLGIIEVNIKGVKKITSKSSSSTGLFAYSKFCFSKRGDRYFLNSCEPIKIFYEIRLDIEKYALASYFADILKFAVVSEEPADVVLRLFLNTLHFLSCENRSKDFLKSIFELRLLTEIGLMPNLVACKSCIEYSSENVYFNILDGFFICENCFDGIQNEYLIKISKSILHTMRFIVFSEFDKLFNFNISIKCQEILSYITEKYLATHLNREFKTLVFYKSL